MTTDNLTDEINRPAHYTSCPSGIECITITELLPFCLGNAYKYLHRAGLKGDTLTDIKKAQYYAKRAFLNNEKMHERAKNRILAVAKHRTGAMRELLQDIAYFNDGGSRSKRIFGTLDKVITDFDNVAE